MQFADNTAIKHITVQHKKGSFPSTLTGHTTLVHLISAQLEVWYSRKPASDGTGTKLKKIC
jgi:hypothetical protein